MLTSILIFLAAALISVPISKRLGFGSVLGYLVAGVILGPDGFGVFSDVESILHLSEFGVIMLLFVIGLELQPSRLWTMRTGVFGLGGTQVVATSLIFTVIGMAAGLPLVTAIIVALTLAASSTPLALQILAEHNALASATGRASFAIVLFQDIMAIPLIALIPLIGNSGALDNGDPWAIPRAFGVLAVFLLGGRLLLQQILRLVVRTEITELFTAVALFTVVGSAWLMEEVGLSMALGAFLAGVLLADSEYRHELEADIEPFKGLLMSLFFIAIGMSINLGKAIEYPALVAGLVAGLVLIKALVLYGVGRAFKKDHRTAINLAIVLSQGGEFAFVILTLATANGLLIQDDFEVLSLVVGLSMATTPILVALSDFVDRRKKSPQKTRDYDLPDDEKSKHVVIAGIGRVGQITGRILRARGIPFTALEPNVEQVELARKFGNPVYYGDPARLDLLRAARTGEASAFVLAVPDMEHSLRIAEIVRKHFPHVPIIARARNRDHYIRLVSLGVQVVERETFRSGLSMAYDVLTSIGMEKDRAKSIVRRFRDHDIAHLHASVVDGSNFEKQRERAIQAAQRLVAVLDDDLADEADGEEAEQTRRSRGERERSKSLPTPDDLDFDDKDDPSRTQGKAS